MPGAFESSEEELSALPIWTFTLGIFSLLTFGLTSVPSIICGHMALVEVRKNTSGSLGKYVAVVGLVIGYAGTALLGITILFLIRFSPPTRLDLHFERFRPECRRIRERRLYASHSFISYFVLANKPPGDCAKAMS